MHRTHSRSHSSNLERLAVFESTPTGDETHLFFEPDTKHNVLYMDGQKPDLRSFKNTKGATLIKTIEKITLKTFSGMKKLI